MNQADHNHTQVSVVDTVENGREGEQANTFYDPTNPVLAPAREIDKSRKKSWKRRLIRWSLVLVLLAGGVFVLYSLVKTKSVNVRVQADNRHERLSAKPQPSPGNSENGLSAEAINIAREAVGSDNPSTNPSANPSSSPGASPTPSPSPGNPRVNYSATEGYGLGPVSDFGVRNENQSQANGAGAQQQSTGEPKSGVVPAAESVAPSRGNPTQSIFVDDQPLKIISVVPGAETARLNSQLEKKGLPRVSVKQPKAVLPPFGTMLPVRTQGVIFTVRTNAYARLELVRDAQGDGWSLPKGTLLIGRVGGSEYDRAFVSVIGYVDPRENRFVKLSGEVVGSDGATGLQGKPVVVDRNRLKQTLRKIASSGLQVAGMAAGALTGRGTVVVNGSGSRLLNPVTDQAGRMINGGDEKRAFVKVAAGQPGFVMVADLPKELHGVDAPGHAPGEGEVVKAAGSLNDREVMELLLFGTPEEIRAALPLMNDEQKRMAAKTLDGYNKP